MVTQKTACDIVIATSVITSIAIMLAVVAVTLGVSLSRPPAPRPYPRPMYDKIGISTHFIVDKGGEFDLLAEAGYKVIRTDIAWIDVESTKTKGQFDFTNFDNYIFNEMMPRKITPMLILDYNHPLYDNWMSPFTNEGRDAFTRYAMECVKRYNGLGIIWELYNEPNLDLFWRPKANVQDYIKLASQVAKAIKSAYPNEMLIGPCTSHFDWEFLEEVFKSGLLTYFDAISIHPYRTALPESTMDEFAKLRVLLDSYTPSSKKSPIPIMVTEWGYSELYPGLSQELQTKYAPRVLLTSIMNNVTTSVYYGWKDDCDDNSDSECFFGTVRYQYKSGSNPVYDLKPSYTAIQTLSKSLMGRDYKRNTLTSANDYCLEFSNTTDTTYACWTTSTAPKQVSIPATSCYDMFTSAGKNTTVLCANNGTVSTSISDTLIYLIRK